VKRSLKSRRENLALYLDVKHFEHKTYTDSYVHARLGFVNILLSESGIIGKQLIRNPLGAHVAFENLSIEGYCYPVLDGVLKPYGMEVRYTNSFLVNLNRAERMVKLLREVQRGLDCDHHKDVSLTSFGQFAQLVAHILGITKFVVRTDAGTHCDYDHMSFSVHEWAEISEIVDDAVRTYCRKVLK
jgi:hypothetical protein